jgi:hypothetical protein
MNLDVFYETGRSNTGDIERFNTKREAVKRAKAIANESGETVFVDVRTEDDMVDYITVKPKKCQ